MADQTMLEINTYRYDPLDRITATGQGAKTVSQRFYNQKRLNTDIQGTSTCSVFEAGNSLLAFHQADLNSRETRLLGTNVQRSVLEVVAPHTTQTIAYTPYGSHSSSEAMLSVLGFNGQRPDPATGHYLLGNGVRAFNPVLMRFNSPDILSPFGEGGINAYVYCAGDPVNWEDPSGFMSWNFLRAAIDIGELEADVRPRLALNREIGHRLEGGMNRRVIAELRDRPAVRHPEVIPEYPNQSAAHRIDEVRAARAQAQAGNARGPVDAVQLGDVPGVSRRFNSSPQVLVRQWPAVEPSYLRMTNGISHISSNTARNAGLSPMSDIRNFL